MAMGPLECSVIVFRAITRATSHNANTGGATPDAFLRRPRDIDGLSVDFNCDPRECGRDLSGVRAVVSLHVGRVRNLGLDIMPDEPTHALIVGVPFRDTEENTHLAEDLAEQLAELARPVARQPPPSDSPLC